VEPKTTFKKGCAKSTFKKGGVKQRGKVVGKIKKN